MTTGPSEHHEAPWPPPRPRRRVLGPRRLVRSFGAAFAGLGHLLWREPNARIHGALALLATALGIWLGLSAAEGALLATLFCLVIGFDALNTAVVELAD